MLAGNPRRWNNGTHHARGKRACDRSDLVPEKIAEWVTACGDRHHFVKVGIIGQFEFWKAVRECRMFTKLENGDIEVVDNTDFGRRHFVHVDLGPCSAAIK